MNVQRHRAAAGSTLPSRRVREEVNTNNMRKLFALAMVASLALALALAAIGCGQKTEESSTTTTETPTTTTTDTSMMMHDTTMADTTMNQ